MQQLVAETEGHRIWTGGWGKDAKLLEWNTYTGAINRELLSEGKCMYSCLRYASTIPLLSSDDRLSFPRVYAVCSDKKIREFVIPPFTPSVEEQEAAVKNFAVREFDCNGKDDNGPNVVAILGSRLYSAGFGVENNRYAIQEWDLATGAALRVLTEGGHMNVIRCLCVSSFDGEKLYSGSADKTILQWDLTSGQVLRKFIGHMQAVRGIGKILVPNKPPLLVSAGEDQMVRVYDLRAEGTEINCIHEYKQSDEIRALDVAILSKNSSSNSNSNSGNENKEEKGVVFVGLMNRQALMLDVENGEILKSFWLKEGACAVSQNLNVSPSVLYVAEASLIRQFVLEGESSREIMDSRRDFVAVSKLDQALEIFRIFAILSQLASFGFSNVFWSDDKSVVDTQKVLKVFHLSFASSAVGFDVKFSLLYICAFFTSVVVYFDVYNESVMYAAKKLRAGNESTYMIVYWSLVFPLWWCVYVCVNFFWMPTLSACFDTFACTRVAAGKWFWDIPLSKEGVLESEDLVECYVGSHLARLVVALILLMLFIPVGIRVSVVEGDMNNLPSDVSRNCCSRLFTRFFTSWHSRLSKRPPYRGFLTANARNLRWSSLTTLILGALLTFFQAVITSYPVALSVINLLIGLGIAATAYVFPPYINGNVCAVNLMFRIQIVWVFVVSVIVAGYDDPSVHWPGYLWIAGIVPLLVGSGAVLFRRTSLRAKHLAMVHHEQYPEAVVSS